MPLERITWPWYSRVAPASWLVSRDVSEGRRHLNFSTWNRFTPLKQTRRISQMWEQVDEGDMPPWYYVPLHRRAVLSDSERETLRAWCESAGK